MPPDLKLLGQKLQRYRSQLQLSLSEVSARTAIAVVSLEEYESGARGPSGDELLILADFFRCDYKDLVSGDKLTPLDRTETLFRRFGDAFNKADRRAVQDFMFLCESEEYLEVDGEHQKRIPPPAGKSLDACKRRPQRTQRRGGRQP